MKGEYKTYEKESGICMCPQLLPLSNGRRLGKEIGE
jgi:hypothetical protein